MRSVGEMNRHRLINTKHPSTGCRPGQNVLAVSGATGTRSNRASIPMTLNSLWPSLAVSHRKGITMLIASLASSFLTGFRTSVAAVERFERRHGMYYKEEM